MKANKFESIVQHNIDNAKEVSACVEKFFNLLGLEPNSEIKNIPQIAGPLFVSKGFVIIHFPLKDKEIGAFCYKNSLHGGYIILNSSLPLNNVNFALCHEICHVCIKEDIGNNNAELYVDDTYLDHENERIANQFAGEILMPEGQIRRMYEKFSAEKPPEPGIGRSTIEDVVCKLMSYFEVPFMAVLIRLRELDIIKYDQDLKRCLDISQEEISAIFEKYWLDQTVLKPSYRDDYSLLKTLLEKIGEDNVRRELMYENDLSATLKTIEQIYKELREDL